MQQSRKIGRVFLSLLGFCKQSNEKLRFSGPRSTLFFKKRETCCVKRLFFEPAVPKNDVLHSFYNDFRSFLGPLASPGLSRPLPASPGLSRPLPASPGLSRLLLAPRRLEEKRRRGVRRRGRGEEEKRREKKRRRGEEEEKRRRREE